MELKLKKFGHILISRQDGREAVAAIKPVLKDLPENEKIILDFEGVSTFTPSWGDEFLTYMLEKYGDRIKMENTENPSVQATLEILNSIKEDKVV
ncbi:DUF4325 domain-containing protein [candidate division WWE3 bacterium]|nr:DUF4325 domain-containing protein [candidate division WWE3 bacterium]